MEIRLLASSKSCVRNLIENALDKAGFKNLGVRTTSSLINLCKRDYSGIVDVRSTNLFVVLYYTYSAVVVFIRVIYF